MAYSFVKAVTIAHGKVPNTDQTNFPVCISGTYAYLATVANGGGVQSASGYDIIFASDSLGASVLNFERAIWTASGQCEFWVQVPTLSHTTDTVIYLLYGNSAITTDQQHAALTWDTHYKSVFHTPLATGTISDSTGSGANLGTQTPAAGFGALQKSLAWVSSGVYIGSVSYPTGTAQRTLEIWFKIAAGTAPPMTITGYGQNFAVVNYGAFVLFFGGSTGAPTLNVDIYQDSTTIAWTPDSNWHHGAAVFPAGSTTINQAKIYLDGVLQTTSGGSHTLASLGSQASIGVYPDHQTGTNMTGSTAEMRASDIARSGDWIATHYNNVSNPATFYTIGAPPPTQRGNIDYDQIRTTARQGSGSKFQMFAGSAPVAGDLAVYDASGNLTDGGSAPATGSVTSVGLAAPAEFTVSGSPVTASGVLTFAKATQAANVVYAGPASGGAVAPTFRTQVAADVPQVIKVNGVLRG